MKRPGPLLTLLAGLLLGVFMLSLNATTGTKSASSYREESPSPKASASPAPSSSPTTAAPSPSPSKSAFPNADYAGRTDDDSSAVAVSLRDGKAIAYFCDGRDKESWLKGDVKDDGTMKLTGKNGAELNGTLKDGKSIRGTVDLGGQRYGFTADKAVRPSGLYRATATVRGAKIDGGWIVLPGGKQVGILDRDGKPSAAPEIDPETGAVTIDGQTLTARPVAP
jgi:major membrane immunogen (membrane-anchored lipoprotein)